jgi:hypothetical protein
MMPHRVQSPDSIIQGMGYPGERVPVGSVEIKKGPLEKSKVQGTDMGIICYVCAVIPPHKIIPERKEINNKSYKRD